MSRDSWMLTTLNGFSIASRPEIPLRSYFWDGSFTCLGDTVRDSMLNLYCETSDIASGVMTPEIRSCAHISVSFAFIERGTRL